MPVPVQSGVINNITYSTDSASDFTVTVSDSYDEVLGTYVWDGDAGTGVFTVGSLSPNPLGVAKIRFILDAGVDLDLSHGDTLSIDWDLAGVATTVIFLYPAYPPTTYYYLDAIGNLFTGTLFTALFDGIVESEILSPTEANDDNVYNETYENLYLTDSQDSDNVVDEVDDTITLSDALAFNESEEETEESLILIETILVEIEENTNDTTLVLDSILEEGEIEIQELLNISDTTTYIAVDETEDNISLIESSKLGFSTNVAPYTLFQIPDYPVDQDVLGNLGVNIEDSRFFKLGTFDLGTRALKHISVIELGIETSSDLYVALEYNYNKTATYKTTNFRKVNPDGFVHIPVTAINFNIIILALETTELKLEYVKIAHKYVDNRNTRGVEI